MKLREAMSTCTRWECTDNVYYYGTTALRALMAWALMGCVQQHTNRSCSRGTTMTFLEVMEETASLPGENLNRDMQKTRGEPQSQRPDFPPVVGAARCGERRLLDAEATRMAVPLAFTVINRNGNGKSHLPGSGVPDNT
ncbi:hypothetical protein TcCL_NonESM10597 [Trypanosoma cruzi]|nr:hypothetical protein TcCL_NonESM10597 [Trypanosoma cruzi]